MGKQARTMSAQLSMTVNTAVEQLVEQENLSAQVAEDVQGEVKELIRS